MNKNQYSKKLNLLSKISHHMVLDGYLDKVLDAIVSATAQMLNSKICSIMLYDAKNQELSIRATQCLSDEYRGKPNLKIGESISGKVVRSKKPIKVFDVTKEPGYMYPDIAKREGVKSMLAVPMLITDRVVGVVNIYTSKAHRFSESEVKILQTIANLAAVAIEKENLEEEVVKTKQSLEERKLIERAKGILMKKFDIGEEEAYKKIHKKSMDSRKPMREIAEALIIVHE